jgi:hypothetical protein
MASRRSSWTLLRMDPPDFRVIVVRAWCDSGGLRIRLLVDGDSSRHWVVGSIAEACTVLGLVLAELPIPPAESGIPRPPTNHGVPDGRGTAPM